MFAVTAAIVIALLIVAAVCDFRSREVPDWISVAIAMLAVTHAAMHRQSIDWALAFLGGVIGLTVGYLLFRFASLGGGDAKLIAALAMLVGPVGLIVVLFGMAVTGGALALIAMFRGQRDFAYVPAIAAGFIGYVALVSRF